MSKARTQPSAQTGLVWKISIVLFLLLAIVLYKLNDYFKQEKWQLAQSQLRTQMISLKTSISSQITTLKNVLSSYENELIESKVNWVQLDPFFGIATGQKTQVKGQKNYQITQYIGRSGSLGEGWNSEFLQKAISQQEVQSDQPIAVQIFQDRTGSKFMILRFDQNAERALFVVGSAEYFQKFFDLSRGAQVTSLLETSEHILAAHSEADYLGTYIEENALSAKRFMIEQEEIPGTNLTVMQYMSRKALTKGFAVPWSVVGLIVGFGFLIVGVLIYTMDPLEKRIEKYKMQEREQVFKETLSEATQSLKKEASDIVAPSSEVQLTPKEEIKTATDLIKAKVEESVSFVEPVKVDHAEPPKEILSKAAATVILEDVPYQPQHEDFVINKEMKPVGQVDDFEDNDDFKVGTGSQVQFNLNQRAGVLTLDNEGNQVDDFEKTAVPQAKEPLKVKTGSVVIDSEEVTSVPISADALPPVPHESDVFDLEKVLSLDDLDSQESTDTDENKVDFIQAHLTSQKINLNEQPKQIQRPTFLLSRKKFKVDELDVRIRRPERT